MFLLSIQFFFFRTSSFTAVNRKSIGVPDANRCAGKLELLFVCLVQEDRVSTNGIRI